MFTIQRAGLQEKNARGRKVIRPARLFRISG